MTDNITAALEEWIDGRVIARRVVDEYGSQVVVTQGDAGFSLFRGFALGDGAGVSVDLQDASLATLVEHLLPDGVSA